MKKGSTYLKWLDILIIIIDIDLTDLIRVTFYCSSNNSQLALTYDIVSEDVFKKIYIPMIGKNTLWAQSSYCSGFISRIQEKPETWFSMFVYLKKEGFKIIGRKDYIYKILQPTNKAKKVL